MDNNQNNNLNGNQNMPANDPNNLDNKKVNPENVEKKYNKFRDPWVIIGFGIIAFIAIGMGYEKVKPLISSLNSELGLNKHRPAIEDCVSNKKVEFGSQEIIGLEYECAIDIAATFYNSEPEKAIELCVRNNVLFDGLDENSARFARAVCRDEIEKVINK